MSERKLGSMAVKERESESAAVQSRDEKLQALANGILSAPDFHFESYLQESGIDTATMGSTAFAPAPAPERARAEPLRLKTELKANNLLDPNLPPKKPEMIAPPPPTIERGDNEGGGNETIPQFTVVALDMSRDARNIALDVADKRIIAELNAQGRGRVKRVWDRLTKGGVLRDMYRARYAREEREKMNATDDILIGTVASAQGRTRARQGLEERFGTNLGISEVIAEAAGERRDIQAEDTPFVRDSKSLIEDFVLGRIERNSFIEGTKRLTNQYHDSDANTGKDRKGKVIENTFRMNNMLAAAEGMLAAIQHLSGLERASHFSKLLASTTFVTGETAIGARADARRDLIDDTTAKWQRRLGKFGEGTGSLLPEEVVAGAVVAGIVAVKSGVGFMARVLDVASFGAAGAVIGGVRGWRHAKQEFAQHERERAMNEGSLSAGDKKRARMEKGLSMMDYGDAIASLENSLGAVRRDPTNPDQAPSQAALDAALQALAAVELRDKEGERDLFRAGEEGFAIKNQEVQKLGILRATLKVELRRELAAVNSAIDIDNIVEQRVQPVIAAKEEVDKILSNREKALNGYVRVEAAKGIVIGAGSQLLGGAVIQEALAALPDFLTGSHTEGLVESAFKDEAVTDTKETTLNHLFGNNGEYVPADPDSELYSVGKEGNSSITVTKDHTFVMNGDGKSFKLVDPYGRATIDNVPINPDGSLTETARQMLREKGMFVNPLSDTYGPSKTEQVTLSQFMEKNAPQTKAVSRHWLDNGTSAITDGSGKVVGGIEGSELGLHWTGTGAGPDGSFHMNVSNMDIPATDRYGNAVSWTESAKSGTLYLAVSPSIETQATPLMVQVLPDGAINIPPDHPAAQFFTNENGRAVFNGAYAEVMHDTGAVNANGASQMQVMATVTGTNEAPSTLTQTIPGDKYTHLEIETAGYVKPELENQPFVGVPVFAPTPIKPLERKEPTPPANPNGGGGGGPKEPTAPTPPNPEIKVEDMPPLVTVDRPPIQPTAPGATAGVPTGRGKKKRSGGPGNPSTRPNPGRPGTKPRPVPGGPRPAKKPAAQPGTRPSAASSSGSSQSQAQPSLPPNAPTRLPIPQTAPKASPLRAPTAAAANPQASSPRGLPRGLTGERVLDRRRSATRRNGSPVGAKSNSSQPSSPLRSTRQNQPKIVSRFDNYMASLLREVNQEIAGLPRRGAAYRAASRFGEAGFTLIPVVTNGISSFEVVPNAAGRAVIRDAFNGPRRNQ